MAFIAGLEKRGIDVSQLDTLEVYGGTGLFHTVRYASHVRNLTVWEISEKREEELKRNLPDAKIKITDSYEEVKATEDTFDLVVVDNPMSTRGFPGQEGRCEHFDLFPDVFRLGRNDFILVINVIPRHGNRRRYPYIFNPEHLRRRSEFYHTDHPENVSIKDMVEIYVDMARLFDYKLEWWFRKKRSFVYYLVLKLVRECLTEC